MKVLIAVALLAATPAAAQAPVLVDPAALAPARRDAARAPLFAAEIARVRRSVDAAMRAGIDVPVPKDAGGGVTHEQHKRNYQTLYGAGLLYRLTGERVYLQHARALLLA